MANLEKLLYIGFDSRGRPREVITDTSASTGRVADNPRRHPAQLR